MAKTTQDTERQGGRALLPWVLLGVAALLTAGGFSLRALAGDDWLKDVTQEENIGGLHTVTPITYKAKPPMGGPHHPTWQNCGVFSEPVGDTHAVHSLEHGAVWITYKPEALDADGLAGLVDVAERNKYVILSPYPEQDAPIVLTAWNNQLRIEEPTDDRIKKFVLHFAKALTAPEPGAPCDQGADTTRATDPEAAGPVMGPGVEVEKLLGMTEQQATQYAKDQGWQFRVGARDGEEYLLTTDYVDTRVTVRIENGKVTDADVG